MTLMDKLGRYEPGISRSTLYRAILSAIVGSAVSLFFANPVLVYCHKFAPWVGPAVVVGLVGLMIIGMLLLPLTFKHSNNKDR